MFEEDKPVGYAILGTFLVETIAHDHNSRNLYAQIDSRDAKLFLQKLHFEETATGSFRLLTTKK